MERVAGIEPASLAWKAKVLPLYHTRNCSKYCDQRVNNDLRFMLYNMERAVGIEPTSLAWKANMLPLYYTRNCSYSEHADYYN